MAGNTIGNKLMATESSVCPSVSFDIAGNRNVVERPFRLHCSFVLSSVVSPDLWQYSLGTAN